ncbi:hypothetical protein T11_6688 [Trichinella zimbabwensis]|uniref:Uncharacterized protein n=1 Tax=Trichinella zimbabwensis TaxID=268475 RepID=A0A0V1H6V8_9BILA|nr:hypothetical protein T11_6688 [Trichinella zimbabwensis]
MRLLYLFDSAFGKVKKPECFMLLIEQTRWTYGNTSNSSMDTFQIYWKTEDFQKILKIFMEL